MTGTVEAAGSTVPLDVDTMRATARRLIAESTDPPATGETEPTELLRGHMALLMPEVERLAARLPKDSIPRYCALACLGEARQKLAAAPSPAPGGAITHARRLARSLNALVDHYETLTGVTMCLACDQPIRDGDESRPYDHVGPSGVAAGSGRIHARCADTVRRR